MSKEPNPYKRVPGLGSSAYEYSRLYVAPDHLMLVGMSAWNESYRRFFFRDIQALIIRKTQWQLFTAALWLIGAFVFAAIALAIGDAVGAFIFWGFTALMLVGLGIDISRGATCACYIKTAVQTTRLGPLKRVRSARRFLEQIRPLIAAAQPEVATSTPSAAVPAPNVAPPDSSPPPGP